MVIVSIPLYLFYIFNGLNMGFLAICTVICIVYTVFYKPAPNSNRFKDYKLKRWEEKKTEIIFCVDLLFKNSVTDFILFHNNNYKDFTEKYLGKFSGKNKQELFRYFDNYLKYVENKNNMLFERLFKTQMDINGVTTKKFYGMFTMRYFRQSIETYLNDFLFKNIENGINCSLIKPSLLVFKVAEGNLKKFPVVLKIAWGNIEEQYCISGYIYQNGHHINAKVFENKVIQAEKHKNYYQNGVLILIYKKFL